MRRWRSTRSPSRCGCSRQEGRGRAGRGGGREGSRSRRGCGRGRGRVGSRGRSRSRRGGRRAGGRLSRGGEDSWIPCLQQGRDPAAGRLLVHGVAFCHCRMPPRPLLLLLGVGLLRERLCAAAIRLDCPPGWVQDNIEDKFAARQAEKVEQEARAGGRAEHAGHAEHSHTQRGHLLSPPVLVPLPKRRSQAHSQGQSVHYSTGCSAAGGTTRGSGDQ